MMTEVIVSDYRHTGKTERIVWMVVGGILAGARPMVAVRAERDAEFVRRRIQAALAKIGQDTPAHCAQARLAVGASSNLRGHGGPVYREVSYE